MNKNLSNVQIIYLVVNIYNKQIENNTSFLVFLGPISNLN